MKIYKGIDISRYQGDINFSALSVDPPDFIIIRAGSGASFDTKCEYNARQCSAYKIPYGLYWASYASSNKECLDEAHNLLSVARNLNPSYPLIYDVEEFTTNGVVRKEDQIKIQTYIQTFCAELEWHNYYAMFYTNLNCYRVWNLEMLSKRFDFWCAAWRSNKPDVKCGIWQNSNKGKINGINGDVDTDISYQNYPEIISRNNLNHYK